MKIAPVADIKAHLSSYLEQVGKGPVIITKNGRDKNVLISAAAFETLVRGRVVRRMEDLDDETLKAIAATEVPPHFASLDKIDLGDPG